MELMDTYNPTVQQLRSKNKQLRQRVQELEQEYHKVCKERDGLRQQRDKLFDTLIYAASCLGTDGCDPIDVVIASVKEKQNAAD